MPPDRSLMQRRVKVTFSDGSEIMTTFDGSDNEIRRYYLGQWFPRDDSDDERVQAVIVELLD